MKNHFLLPDETFEHQFAEVSLNPKLFSHEAHLRLAWIHIRKYGVEKAVVNICRQIAAFDAKFGDGTKYNETVTVAAVRAVNHFVERSSATDFKSFIQENPRLKHNFKDLLNSHYSQDIFLDERAKTEYLEPDLAPF